MNVCRCKDLQSLMIMTTKIIIVLNFKKNFIFCVFFLVKHKTDFFLSSYIFFVKFKTVIPFNTF